MCKVWGFGLKVLGLLFRRFRFVVIGVRGLEIVQVLKKLYGSGCGPSRRRGAPNIAGSRPAYPLSPESRNLLGFRGTVVGLT